MGAILTILLLVIIGSHIIRESLPAIMNVLPKIFDIEGKWRPMNEPPKYSIMPAITGTLYVSFLALIIALVFGLGTALLLSFYTPSKLKEPIVSLIDLLAGIPSVIFGFIGLTVVVKVFVVKFKMAAGQCILAAAIVLAVMLLPYIVSTCSESMEVQKRKYKNTAYSLGFTKEYMILRIILPSIKPAIIASTMMAFGRVLGETMAVMMVVGNSPIYPRLLGRGQTISALTALEMGSIEYNSIHLSVLYTANLVLLLILMIVYGLGYLYQRRIDMNE